MNALYRFMGVLQYAPTYIMWSFGLQDVFPHILAMMWCPSSNRHRRNWLNSISIYLAGVRKPIYILKAVIENDLAGLALIVFVTHDVFVIVALP